MALILENSQQKLTYQDIIEFNLLFDEKIPSYFLDFFHEFNGGNFPKVNDHNCEYLSGFYSIKYGHSTITRMYNELLIENPELQFMLPFAYDHNLDSYLISLKEDDYGAIYLWSNEEQGIAHVSNSFDDFIQSFGQFIDAVEMKKMSNNIKNSLVKTFIMVGAIFIVWYLFSKR
ncbi:SMI1/KNR4 family protein [Gilliamella apicola]|uniref:SMI1/KNR4 family protein n=1 Tax=Gilliamella apicola TaxID=1196095 RepID=UPI002FEE1C26